MIDDRTVLTRPPAAFPFPMPHFARRRPAVALAATVLCGALAAPSAAWALVLNGIAVQSSVGEPLRARIAVTEISETEAASLQVRPASASAFREAGFGAPSPALSDLRIRLERPTDGPAVLQIEGSQPVLDPSLPLLLDIRWQGGSLMRNYTLQIDPAGSRPRPRDAGRASVAPQLGAAPQGRPSTAGAVAGTPAADGPVTVRRGDTASRIAAARRPPDVSLDQMLVALLQANPQAFIDGNINRMRAGAVIQIPDTAQIRAVDPSEARRQIVAQSSDFNEFRRRLAGRAAPLATASGRSTRGNVAAQLDDRRASGSTPDRLTLSQGASEERLAQEKQSRADAARQAELQRNIGELQRLGTAPAAASAAAAPAAAPAPATPGAPPAASAAPAPAPAPEPTPPAPAASPEPAPEAAPAPAPSPAPVAAPTPPPATPAAEDQGDTSRSWPWKAGAGVALALLAGLLAYRLAQRRRARNTEAQAFQESRDNRDSFFDPANPGALPASEDTPDAAAAALASQFDGAVDPIAEADVYLAYGREQQAEDILREAIRQHPERTPVHVRLLDILARRGDLPAFTALARETHATTGGTGTDWDRAAVLGREIDPANPLYHDLPEQAVQAAQAAQEEAQAVPEALAPNTEPLTDEDTIAFAPTLGPDALDADLPAPRDTPPEPAFAQADDAPYAEGTGSAPPPEPEPDAAPAPAPAPSADAAAPMDFGLDFNLDAPAGRDGTPAAASPGKANDFGFDFGPDAAAPRANDDDAGTSGAGLPEDTLATKLDLAQEFEAIGDADGARTLIKEVIESSSGSLHERARRMLADLG